MIGIFNRSHYDDVVTVGVLELAPEEVWRQRAVATVLVEALRRLDPSSPARLSASSSSIKSP